MVQGGNLCTCTDSSVFIPVFMGLQPWASSPVVLRAPVAWVLWMTVSVAERSSWGTPGAVEAQRRGH